jgi:5-dehydro-2-deoxygluconokinase
VLLGLDAPEEELAEGFRAAAGQRWVKGFTVGRSLWAGACRAWLAGERDDRSSIDTIAENYLRMITVWRARTQGRATTDWR